MKKFLIVILIVFLVVISGMIVLPQIYKSEITQIVKDEINNNVNAIVDFTDVSISLFNNFPDLYFSLNELSVTPDNGDRLVIIKRFELEIDLLSIISGDNILIEKINIESPQIWAIVLSDGSANWDIVHETNMEKEVSESSSEGNLSISLQEFTISNASIAYVDEELDMSMEFIGADINLSGDMSETVSELNIIMKANEFNFHYEGIKYMNSVNVDFEGGIKTDIDKFEFSFLDNELLMNDFPVKFDGLFAMPGDDMVFDLIFSSPKTKFKYLLSLVPGIYVEDFKDIETDGKLSFNGKFKGKYNDDVIPGFDINLNVSDAFFKYPGLPVAVEAINLDFNASGDGIPDNTIVNIEKFSAKLADSYINSSLKLSTPESDPSIKAEMICDIDLAGLQSAIPFDGIDLAGKLLADLKMNGRMSYYDNEEFDKFQAKGYFSLSDVVYKSPDIPESEINIMKMSLSTEQVVLNQFVAKIGSGDIKMNGSLQNFIPYILNDQEIKGNLVVESKYLNIDELMGDDISEEPESSDTLNSGVIEIPYNIDFTFQCYLKSVIYDNLSLEDCSGKLYVKDGNLNFEKFGVSVFDGNIDLSGSYNSTIPGMDMYMKIVDIDIPSTYEAFVTVQKLAPIASYCSGKVSAKLKIESLLNDNMEPVLSSVNSVGRFQSDEIGIVNMKVFSTISDKLKMPSLSNPVLKDVNIYYRMKDGNIEVDPFIVRLGEYNAVVSGSQNIDMSINYKITTLLPLSKVGETVSSISSVNISSLGTGNIDVDILITGTMDKSEVNFEFGNTVSEIKETIVEKAKTTVKEKIDSEKQKLKEDAIKRADELMKEAERNAEAVKNSAKQAATRIIAEGNKQADVLIKAAKKKTFVEKKIAEAAAEKIRKESSDKAKKLTTEADRKADGIMSKAQIEKDNILL